MGRGYFYMREITNKILPHLFFNQEMAQSAPPSKDSVNPFLMLTKLKLKAIKWGLYWGEIPGEYYAYYTE